MTRPLTVFPQHIVIETALYPTLVNRLLPFPQLPSSLPISSLTHLTKTLPIIAKLLPYASSHPDILSQNALATELGKTHLLANLGFMVVQTGAIKAQSWKSVVAWVTVITTLLTAVDDEWGLWLESKGVWGERAQQAAIEAADVVDSMEGNDIDLENDSRMTIRQRRIQARGNVPVAVVNRALALVGTDHLTFLTATYIRQPAMSQPYIRYMLALLTKFRGSVRYDTIMEVLGGQHGTRLVRDLWRNQVRGKWPSVGSRQTWERLFATNADPAGAELANRLPPLLLLTQIYIHHLLTVTDEEFFAPASREAAALSLDEVTELSGIWRDIAFWGYWSGLGSGGHAVEKQKEEIRGLMTRGVLAITARE